MSTVKPNDDLIVSSTEPTGLNRKKVWLQKGKNIFDKNHYHVFNGYINGDTLKFVKNDYGKTVYVNVKPNSTYSISREILVNIFAIGTGTEIPTENGQVTSYMSYSNSNNVTIKTGKNDNYIYVYVLWTKEQMTTLEEILESLQIEQSLTATEYEEYIESKIYIRNDNNVYEELISKESAISNQIKQYDYTFDCGLILHFLKIGKMVTCFSEGTINNLTADVNQTVNLSADLTPFLQFRQALVLDETDIIAYINLTISHILEFRVKTTITSNKFPRFSFTYIAQN